MDSSLEKIITECLNAAIHGPFIPEWEFPILFGLNRSEVAAVLDQWPRVDLHDETVRLAINNSFNNLIGYPIDHPERWEEYISVSKQELAQVYEQWKS